jgi:lipid-A-disaccharide synthase
MKYFLIAGEASGDLHGAALMKSLKERDPEAEFLFFGGELMLEQGGRLLKHYREMAFMGGIDVLMNIGKIKANFKLCRQQLLETRPDVLILIDYPGFNLKMAEFAFRNDIKVFYYILPKVWAWKAWRVKALEKYVDGLFSIFPFEVEFFRQHSLNVHYVGNPLLDAISETENQRTDFSSFISRNNLSPKPVVALLPGSRAQEIKMMLPVMTKLAKEYPGFQFVVSGTTAVDKSYYTSFSSDSGIPVLFGQTYELLRFAYAAVVTSGTATLETALFNVPQIVLYKMAGGKLGYALFRLIFLKIKYVSLPNLILNREFLKEFVMDTMKYELIKPEAGQLFLNQDYRTAIFNSYLELRVKMGEKGASGRAASTMIEMLKSMHAIK